MECPSEDAVGDGACPWAIYNAGGPGNKLPSLELIPGPYPKIYNPPQIGILPCGGEGEHEHYAVVFPAQRFEARWDYGMRVCLSESQTGITKTATVTEDRETGCYDVLRHKPSKAVPASGNGLAWIDLWGGVLLCNVLDDDPVLRVLQWPVPQPRNACIEMHTARSIWDVAVTVSNDDEVIRFVELSFDDDNGGDRGCGWTASVWKREVGSEYWYKCFKANLTSILAYDSRFSHLHCKVWDDDLPNAISPKLAERL